jgi:ABC-type tungstate transport system permease subunit
MAVAVGMGVAVGESVGESVRVSVGTGAALAVGEAGGALRLAHPTKQNKMNSGNKVCRIISLLFFRGKCIDAVYCISIHNR